MFFKKKKVHDLFQYNLIWREIELCEFVSIVDGEECKLTMNDFPDEPMYTLTFKGELVDFEDKPNAWEISSFKK